VVAPLERWRRALRRRRREEEEKGTG